MKAKYLPLLITLAGVITTHARPENAIQAMLPSPLTDGDFHQSAQFEDAQVELGKMLFYDKILSGNRNISCATCHHPFAATTDGLSLSVGEGGQGISTSRITGVGADQIHERVPRNAPAIFNLGAKEFEVMFHDGRVAVDARQPSGFISPAGDQLPSGLINVLAAQAMFPVTSATEMAGQSGENAIADAAHEGNLAGDDGVWALLADRLRAVPAYVELFRAAYPEVLRADDITFVHATNAIAAFESVVWRADDSPFDQYLKGDVEAISMRAFRGMMLFYGEARCSQCHSGALQTDHDFHAIGMPQIGPGKGDGVDGAEDFGRERVSRNPEDRFKFRTPSLRNVVLTGPWGHAGSYNTLEGVIAQHLDPTQAMQDFDRGQLLLPPRVDLDEKDYVVLNDDYRRNEILKAATLPNVSLNEKQIALIIDFLNALTDYNSVEIREDVPVAVPSGLVVFD